MRKNLTKTDRAGLVSKAGEHDNGPTVHLGSISSFNKHRDQIVPRKKKSLH